MSSSDNNSTTTISLSSSSSSSSSSSFTLSPEQEFTLELIALISGTLSAIGSTCIILYILLLRKQQRRRQLFFLLGSNEMYQRLMLGLSISDVLLSIRAIVAPFWTPKEHSTTTIIFPNHANLQTCNVLGFFSQLGFSSTCYTICLSIYFYYKIQPRTNTRTTLQRIEPWMHGISILYPLITAVAGIPLELYNPLELGMVCWIAPYPHGCLEDDSCTRGGNAPFYLWVFGAFLVVIGLLIVTYCMLAIYCSVRKQVKIMTDRYEFGRNQNDNNHTVHPPIHTNSTTDNTITAVTNSNTTTTNTTPRPAQRRRNHAGAGLSTSIKLQKTAEQAILYILAYILTYLWTAISRFVEGSGDFRKFYAVAVLSAIFFPLQGFWNCFIYFRPKYNELRQQQQQQARRSRGNDDGSRATTTTNSILTRFSMWNRYYYTTTVAMPTIATNHSTTTMVDATTSDNHNNNHNNYNSSNNNNNNNNNNGDNQSKSMNNNDNNKNNNNHNDITIQRIRRHLVSFASGCSDYDEDDDDDDSSSTISFPSLAVHDNNDDDDDENDYHNMDPQLLHTTQNQEEFINTNNNNNNNNNNGKDDEDQDNDDPNHASTTHHTDLVDTELTTILQEVTSAASPNDNTTTTTTTTTTTGENKTTFMNETTTLQPRIRIEMNDSSFSS